MRLLQSQKNELFNIITGLNLSANQFELKDGNPTIIIYKAIPDYNFKILESSNTPYVYYSPGDDKFSISHPCKGWTSVTISYYEWLLNLLKEIAQEDLWGNMNRMVASISFDRPTENEKFTVNQYITLSEKMKQLQVGISALSLPQEQIDTINRKLDQVLEQGKILGQFDWQSQLVGTIISLVISLTISQETGKQIWDLVRHYFSGVILIP